MKRLILAAALMAAPCLAQVGGRPIRAAAAAPACGAWLLPGTLCSWEPPPVCGPWLPYGASCSWEVNVHHVTDTASQRMDPNGIPAPDMLVAIFVHVPARTGESWWSTVDLKAGVSGPGSDVCTAPSRKFTLSLRDGVFCLSR